MNGIVANSSDHFILCPGRCLIEVVPRHVSRGSALDVFMGLPASRGAGPSWWEMIFLMDRRWRPRSAAVVEWGFALPASISRPTLISKTGRRQGLA